jgi:hypothetical protein
VDSPFDEKEIGAILLLVYNAGFWDSLDPELQQKGQVLLQKMMDEGIELQPPQAQSPRLSLNEYISLIGNALGLDDLQSEFRVIVIKVCYLMMAAEKDPLFAQKLKESQNMRGYLSEIFGE